MNHAQSVARISTATPVAHWLQALRGALVLMVLCGGLYPLFTVAIGAALFHVQSTGSLIERDGQMIGSALVGQPFSAPGYFHGRPSVAGYDPFAVSGSNLAPSNPTLRERASVSSSAFSAANGVAPTAIPVDLVAASGSGIDPHISPAAAEIQIDRVAAARGRPRSEVAGLVAARVERPVLGVLGQPRVNVLQLNLALDALGSEAGVTP
ncbi:potassium-transporting ATPase subunit KdpC [Allochromatium humboldtianum]|uniref:Potassium-transporting ATPase KdpC subunit n=1 Tax=Allochromatium humboldtianum TaxID=504901 RepID=A0A850RH49_9GAMM|nr:potassium-transporting ATPase subunit KdpC [Allochromatium humboldtianum]NVZ08921.1 potassium-transporting ATPase subunit KdpC [Allochromatium humboldtianum]